MTLGEWFDDKSQVIFAVTFIAILSLLLAGLILWMMPQTSEDVKVDLVKGILILVGNIVTGLFGIGIGRAISKNSGGPPTDQGAA